MSSDAENEYFSDGITEEIINSLSKINGLHVTARTSSFAFKNQNIDVRKIGKKLNVALILEGSIRKSDNIVRITAQLTKSADGYHVWSDTWDRELKNIFIVQDEIATIIAEKVNKDIKAKITKAGHVVENTEAIDWYLKGNYLQYKWDFNQRDNIVSCFKKAIELDPGLIKGYIGLSNVYTWLAATGFVDPIFAHTEIEKNIKKILKLDKNTPEAYIIIAGKYFWIEWNFPLALQYINKALELQPSNADALKYKGLILAAMGRVEEALDFMFQSERLDPYNEQINSGIGMIYNWTNENEKAIEFIEKNIEVCPYWYAQYIDHVEVLCRMKDFNKAWKTIEMLENDPDSPLNINLLKAYYFASRGENKKAYNILNKPDAEQIEDKIHDSPDAAYFSQIYILLGDYEKALDYLEYGLDNNSTPLLFIKINSLWNELREHPRYINAIKRIKFSDDELKQSKYRRTNVSKEQAVKIEENLIQVMLNDKLYLNPTLTLSDLAESVNITTNQLSQILNEFIGNNFYDYVNKYRLDYFLEIRNSPKCKNFTILALAYESGFNSKTTFNAFFKKTLKKSPSEYFKVQ